MFADFGHITLEPFFYNPTTEAALEGEQVVWIEFKSTNNVTNKLDTLNVTSNERGDNTIRILDVMFIDGFATIELYGLNTAPFIASKNIFAEVKVQGEGFTSRFDFSSLGYVIVSQKAQEVLSVDAGVLMPGTVFSNVVTVNTDIVFGDNFLIQQSSPYFRDKELLDDSRYAMDFEGLTVNVKKLYLNGVDFMESNEWKPTADNALYSTVKVGVGIGSTDPINYALQVSGHINAAAYLINGYRLTALADWQSRESELDGDYYFDKQGNIGVSQGLPQEQLDIDGGIRLSSAESYHAGSLYYDSGKDRVYGVVTESIGVTVSVELGSLQVTGNANRLAFFDSGSSMNYSDDLAVQALGSGLGLLGNDAVIEMIGDSQQGPFFSVVTTQNETLVSMNYEGRLVVHGDSFLAASDALSVLGGFNATEYLIDGVSIVLKIVQGEIFLKNEDNSIFYDMNILFL